VTGPVDRRADRRDGAPQGPGAGAVEDLLRRAGPRALAAVVRRGAGFADAEDAVQEALLEAGTRWPADGEPDDPVAWLVTVAWRRFLDARRAHEARQRREERHERLVPPGPTEQDDDTLLLLSRCCHASLSAASAVALTLRAVAGLTTAQVARAYLVPEATMAQRISRAKRTLAGATFDRPGDVGAVLKVLYVMFSEGHSGEIDLALEAIRLTRQLAAATDDPEVDGLLALMLLTEARRGARWTDDGALVALADQDRSRWDTTLIAEGVALVQGALARDRLGEYQVQAAIAALHDDAAAPAETDWPQVLEWYDELLRLTPSPVVALNRAVAVGEVDGPRAGLAVLDGLDPALPRLDAVAAYLTERAGDLADAARRYARAAATATSVPERDHLLRQAARLNAAARRDSTGAPTGVRDEGRHT
jgi:RNA polymerase sigma factor (sigma-70 family)